MHTAPSRPRPIDARLRELAAVYDSSPGDIAAAAVGKPGLEPAAYAAAADLTADERVQLHVRLARSQLRGPGPTPVREIAVSAQRVLHAIERPGGHHP